MSELRSTRVLAVLFALSFGIGAFIVTLPTAQAATWTQTTDADFLAGTLNGVEVVGTGAPAYVRLLHDAMDWSNEAPPSPPSARDGPTMAYDSANNVDILFGGDDGTALLGDTWRYAPGTNTWTLMTSTGPSARSGAAMAFDSANGVFVLFGGLSDLGLQADTWEYSASSNTWTQTTPTTSPPTMTTPAMAFDSKASRSILVGPNSVSGAMETWAYDAAANTWANRAPSTSPSSRSGHAVAYFAPVNNTVLFGGVEPNPPPSGTFRGDTWEYNYAANSWTQTVAQGPGVPSPRAAHGMAYRNTTKSLYLFGGSSGTGLFGDTWRYADDNGNRIWLPEGTQRSPSARRSFGFANEASNKKLILFGGRDASGARSSETWSLGPAYRGYGTLTSSVFDSGGANAVFSTISWLPTTQPGSTLLRFQTAASNDPSGPWDVFVGPDCQPISYYLTSGTAVCSSHSNNRYFRYRAYLTTSNDSATPTFDEFDLVYNVPASNPYLVYTSPTAGQLGVPLTAPIFVRFSEAMNTTSVTWSITPAISVTPSWSEGNSALTLSHATPFLENKVYTVDITGGTDLAGNPLMKPGLVPTPWSFVTLAVNPTIIAATPSPGQIDVPLSTAITVDFSEAMDPPTVNWTITPSVGLLPVWSGGDTHLTLTHTVDFVQCTVYTVQIGGKDLAGLPLVPGAVPNPWTFKTICINPYIVATDPGDLQTGVPLTNAINVTFSKPMNTATVTWTITPTIALTPTWTPGNTFLSLGHAAAFLTCTVYEVKIGGSDTGGNPLIPGPAPNPWKFATTCANPMILLTDPKDGATGVNLLANITVVFSKAMDNRSVTASITPSIPLVQTWSGMNQIVTLSHAVPFGCGMNTVQVSGNDSAGNPLVSGFVPNPWKFVPACVNPVIMSTNPADTQVDVALTAPIVVTFSKAMSIPSVTWGIVPSIGLSPTWSSGDTVLTLSHSTPFLAATEYRVQIAGNDTAGNPLASGIAPNPWRFTTVRVNPQILVTDPVNGATGVLPEKVVVITFSQSMNPATVTATPSPAIPFQPVWSSNDTVLSLGHLALFSVCTTYTITVVGNDTAGLPLVPGPVPNPFSFTVLCTAPVIDSTVPANRATNVDPVAQLVIVFSKPMNTTSVTVTLVPPATLVGVWTVGDTVLTLTPSAALLECTVYDATVVGKDKAGTGLGTGPVPNPWNFTTVCPYVANTNPLSAAANVPLNHPVFVNFSTPMNTALVTWTFSPAIVVSPIWSNGDRMLTLTHAAPFVDCQPYTVTIAGTDKAGLALGPGPVPNPWTFTALCVAPKILSTNPANGTLNVPPGGGIVVTFSKAMNTGSVTWTFAPPATLTSGWTGGNTILTLTPSPVLTECQKYTVTILGQDTSGTPLATGPVPNPWSFTVACPVGAPTGLRVARVLPSTVRLTWNAVPLANVYRVYESQNRFTAFPWTLLTETAALTYDATGQLTDGLTHFYIIRAVRVTTEGPNSTMAAKIEKSIAFNPAQANVYWFSLPYRSEYTRASDIANDLGAGRIDVVAKWDAATQSTVLWYYFRGSWRGTNFPIAAGEGLYIGSVRAFPWSIVGTDGPVSLSFTYNTPPRGNLNWVSLPYTSTYKLASDVVLDIEGSLGAGARTKIVEVAKWDAATQSLLRYYWTTTGWTGNNFALNPGDAVSFRIVASFSWQPKLVTPEVP